MKERMTIEEFEEEIINGEFRDVKINENCTVRGLLKSFTNGSCKLEDYGTLDVVTMHLLEPCGYHIEIVKNK